MKTPIQMISFLSTLCWKILFSRKLVSTFISLYNSNSIVKNSESPPIRVLIHDHILVSRLIEFIVITQSEELNKVIFLVLRRGVQGNCLLSVEKSCTNLTKLFCQVVYKELILSIQNQDKENLKRVTWGLDVGHEDRARIKSLVFAFAYFLRFISFPASYFI